MLLTDEEQDQRRRSSLFVRTKVLNEKGLIAFPLIVARMSDMSSTTPAFSLVSKPLEIGEKGGNQEAGRPLSATTT